ncbi:fimbrial protein [Enterobacter sp. 22325]|uniref:fimbrial protein n=1 Tax=Enterobacter sp. 22325 TaxID=3453911 RepID=UPI003F87C55D
MKQMFFAILFFITASSHCAADADISFHGRLVEYVPCIVNSGEEIIVDFGDDVMTSRIDDGSPGGDYTMSFQVSNDCPFNALIRYQIKGKTVSLDNKTLAGDREGLGFRFWQNDYLTLNTWFTTTTADPTIYVTPARVNGVAINGGQFSTVATLLAEYQ